MHARELHFPNSCAQKRQQHRSDDSKLACNPKHSLFQPNIFMAIQIGDFVQLSDEHARYDMTDGVGTRDGSLRTPSDYGRVSGVDARLKLIEVTSVTRLDADAAAIKWSYGVRQLKRADQAVGKLCSCQPLLCFGCVCVHRSSFFI